MSDASRDVGGELESFLQRLLIPAAEVATDSSLPLLLRRVAAELGQIEAFTETLAATADQLVALGAPEPVRLRLVQAAFELRRIGDELRAVAVQSPPMRLDRVDEWVTRALSVARDVADPAARVQAAAGEMSGWADRAGVQDS
jgi:hypothetical protein